METRFDYRYTDLAEQLAVVKLTGKTVLYVFPDWQDAINVISSMVSVPVWTGDVFVWTAANGGKLIVSTPESAPNVGSFNTVYIDPGDEGLDAYFLDALLPDGGVVHVVDADEEGDELWREYEEERAW